MLLPHLPHLPLCCYHTCHCVAATLATVLLLSPSLFTSLALCLCTLCNWAEHASLVLTGCPLESVQHDPGRSVRLSDSTGQCRLSRWWPVLCLGMDSHTKLCPRQSQHVYTPHTRLPAFTASGQLLHVFSGAGSAIWLSADFLPRTNYLSHLSECFVWLKEVTTPSWLAN